jgi:hypothetical protein
VTGKTFGREKALQFIGPNVVKHRAHTKAEETQCALAPASNLNNTLRQGRRGQGGTVKVSILGVGQLLCIEDILNDRNHTVTARCISKKGVLMAITAEDFLRHMSKDYENWAMIGEATIERDEATKEKLRDTKRALVKYNEPMSNAPKIEKPKGPTKFDAK